MRKFKSVESDMKESTLLTLQIKKIIKKHYEQLYVNKLDHLDKMNRFLEDKMTKTDSRNRQFE